MLQSLDNINLWTVVPAKLLCKMAEHGIDTMDVLWKWICYDMQCLLLGTFLNVDPEGNPWAGDYHNRPQSGRIMGKFNMAFIQTGVNSTFN